MIRDAVPDDFGAIVRLNLESERLMSPMGLQRLHELHAQAAYRKVAVDEAGQVVAFLLAFREGAAYDSVNYRWFAQRYPQFVYVDRIAVAATHRGRGVGAMMYQDLFAFAREQGVPCVACEFDVEPPNPESARFHARYGFREVGSQWVAGGKKRVSMQLAPAAQSGRPT